MAADGPETFVYVSNAGTSDINVLSMNRHTRDLTMNKEGASLVSLPTALAPNKRYIYPQLRKAHEGNLAAVFEKR